ncbi:MAG TPA: ZIP family metal transporter [Xanthobacteraceae bacterium]|nr:ZIP family metal transporter [Xanthobacteraceae bacterium]
MAIALSLATFISTLLGGLFALYWRDRLHLIVGFSAGALLGVALFELIPESLELASAVGRQAVAGVIAVGFAGYMLLDRTVAPHGDKGPRTKKLWHRGVLGAASLAAHSFLDGFAIGLGFKVSAAVGTIVAAAVLAHDFSDGINTISVILRNKGDNRSAFRWLLIDAAAPVAGAASTLVLPIQQDILGLILALFAGSFLYLSASDLLPESYHDHPTGGTTAMTVLGLLAVYAAVRFASL